MKDVLKLIEIYADLIQKTENFEEIERMLNTLINYNRISFLYGFSFVNWIVSCHDFWRYSPI